MERICVESSLKDIPIPSRETYMKALISKTNSLIRRVRWRVFYAEKKKEGMNIAEQTEIVSQFKTRRNPPYNNGLEKFERELLEMITNIRYKKIYKNMDYMKKLKDKLMFVDNIR